MLIGYGRRLALELLEDDIAAASPLYKKSLLSCALTLVMGWAGPELIPLNHIALTAANSTDQAAYEIVKTALTDGFQSTGRARIASVAVLKSWEKEPGRGGALAKRLLGSDNSWRPRTGDARKLSKHPRLTASAKISPLWPDINLDADKQHSRTMVLASLERLEYPIELTAAEAATVAKQEISLSQAVALQPHLHNSEVLQSFARAISELSIDDAALAISLRKIPIAMVERYPVGQSQIISVPGQGLF